MRIRRVGLAGMLSVAALLAGVGVACAQNAQEVLVAPGIVLMVPAGTALQGAGPMALPDPVAMLQQMDAQMARMDALMQTQLQQAAVMPMANGAYSGVAVTSFSDGQHSCTERLVYPAGGAARQVQVSETGNACGSLGAVAGAMPASAPLRPKPLPASTAPYIQKGPVLVIADNN